MRSRREHFLCGARKSFKTALKQAGNYSGIGKRHSRVFDYVNNLCENPHKITQEYGICSNLDVDFGTVLFSAFIQEVEAADWFSRNHNAPVACPGMNCPAMAYTFHKTNGTLWQGSYGLNRKMCLAAFRDWLKFKIDAGSLIDGCLITENLPYWELKDE